MSGAPERLGSNQTESIRPDPRYAPWDDLKEHERIERLRQIVKGLTQTVNYLRKENRILKRHTHDMRGEVVIPISSADETAGMCDQQASSNRPWF